MKSLIGVYGDSVAVLLVMTPASVLPEVPPKSTVPSNAVKLCVTTLVGDATKFGAVGGVTVMVAVPVPVTVSGEASLLSILMVCTIVPVAVRSTWVSTPSDGSNWVSVTLDDQLVAVWSIASHTVCVAVCAPATAGTKTTTIAAAAIAPSVRRVRFQARTRGVVTPLLSNLICGKTSPLPPAPQLVAGLHEYGGRTSSIDV